MKKITIVSRDTRADQPVPEPVNTEDIEKFVDVLFDSMAKADYERKLLGIAFPKLDDPALDNMTDDIPQECRDELRQRLSEALLKLQEEPAYADILDDHNEFAGNSIFLLAPIVLRLTREMLTKHVIEPYNARAQINPELHDQI